MGRPYGASIFALLLAISACSGGGGNGSPGTSESSSTALDSELLSLAKDSLGLTGDPATPRGAKQVEPDTDPLVKLGELLFFSRTLSGGYDVACVTCHHPKLGASDELSISVGVAAVDPSIIGPGRAVDPYQDLDPSADGGPNMHRNSITTFNAALFDRNLMYDGRIQVLDSATLPGGHGQTIQTPESGQRADLEPVDGLIEFTAKAPIVNDNEMRGYRYPQLATADEYRDHLVRRLRGEVDTSNNPNPDGPANWLTRFQAAFNAPGASAASVITIENVQRALAAYVDSQIFIDSGWKRYLDGDLSALTPDAKQGAMLFLKPLDQGGLGCASCHSGDRFTDESFHNVGFPQIGRGFQRADGTDLGRWMTTRQDTDFYAYRTPSLLNTGMTAPYGHAGTFSTLLETLRYHVDPRRAIDQFDFSLKGLAQFRAGGVIYPDAEAHTRAAIAEDNFATAEALLPQRPLTSREELQLMTFILSLSDRCVVNSVCISSWVPAETEDPDGNMLTQDVTAPSSAGGPGPADYPQSITLNYPSTDSRTTFADVESCTDGLATQSNTGELRFVQRSDPSFGLVDPHGFSHQAWFNRPSLLEVAMIGGGVSAGYLNDDCWPDLLYASGVSAGMVVYENVAGSFFQGRKNILHGLTESEFTGSAFADLNGDYRREIVLGNLWADGVPILAQDGAGEFSQVATLPMVRPTFGISFAPLDSSGLPYMYLAHWSEGSGGDAETSPALWQTDGTTMKPWDVPAHTTPSDVDQRFNFTPKFADFTGDGLTDLVIASDFRSSSTLRNISQTSTSPEFVNETDRSVINDQNGMGSALLDIDNDGTLEWFVTSVFQDASDKPEGNWGQSGNRLYHNVSTADRIAFDDITTAAGVRDGSWGWGACAADINNDGFIDLFHGNGFGYIPDNIVDDTVSETNQAHYNSVAGDFIGQPPRLFINDGDGTFTEDATGWGISVPSEGRGVVCFDFDRDGDIDIAVLDQSTGLQFFENESGSGPGRHFVNLRLVGEPPNTDAIGAKVLLTADIGNNFGVQTQLRLSQANSNFNSQNLPDLHFGLGQADVVDTLRIIWPDQSETVCTDFPVNGFLVVDQRDGAAACPAGP